MVLIKTHFDNSVSDNDLDIEDMRLFRRDRKKCKGGGCVMYCRNYLQAVERKDLNSPNLEAVPG